MEPAARNPTPFFERLNNFAASAAGVQQMPAAQLR
jgi:hypothetical protein